MWRVIFLKDFIDRVYSGKKIIKHEDGTTEMKQKEVFDRKQTTILCKQKIAAFENPDTEKVLDDDIPF